MGCLPGMCAILAFNPLPHKPDREVGKHSEVDQGHHGLHRETLPKNQKAETQK